MYNTTFVCTSNLFAQEDDIASDLYRAQILQAFGDIDDIAKAEDEINILYKEMITLDAMRQAIDSLKNNGSMSAWIQLAGGDECAFRLLFGFDLFYATHKCVCDWKNKGNISDDTSKILLEACTLIQG